MPSDLQLNDKEEKFTVNVEFDTGKLYGVVKGAREITIYRD